MKFKKLILGLLLAPSILLATHTTGRKLNATDITNASNVSIFRFPTSLPTASMACVTNADSEITSSSITSTQLGYLSGVTSGIQSQLDLKANLAGPTFTGTVSGISGAMISMSDVTTNNVTTSQHGFAPKGDGNSTHFLNGNLGWTAPAASSPVKAWANFSAEGGTITTRASSNLTITRNAAGDFTGTFGSAMADANYVVNVNVGFAAANVFSFVAINAHSGGTESAPSTSAFSFIIVNAAQNTYEDLKYISVSVVGN